MATAFAAVIWASYAFFIGRLGGKAFEDRPWVGLLLALGLTVVISVLIEAATASLDLAPQQAAARPYPGASRCGGTHPSTRPAPVRPAGTAALGLTEQRDSR